MKGKYVHRFDQIVVNNRWKRNRIMRSDSWTFIGVGLRWFSTDEYEYVISFFGIDVRIWMRRNWIEL